MGRRVNQQPPTFPQFSDGHRRHPDVIQALHELTDLCAEALSTVAVGSPNPGARTGRTRRPRPGSKPPVNLDLLDALAPEQAGRGVQWELAQAVRAVWEDCPELPLGHEPSIAADCAWLLAHAGAWQPDPFLCEFVTDAVDTCYRLLQALVRTVSPLRLACPRCDFPLHVEAGGSYLRCEAGHVVDHHAEIRRVGEVQHATLGDIATMLDIPWSTLRNWREKGAISPIPGRRRGQLFDIAEVREVALRVKTG